MGGVFFEKSFRNSNKPLIIKDLLFNFTSVFFEKKTFLLILVSNFH